MRADDTIAVGAARALGLVRSSEWPLVAAHLLTGGADGDSLAELASLSRGSSPWQVDRLLDDALAEAGIPDIDVAGAGEVLARVLAQALGNAPAVASEYPIILALGPLAAKLDYPTDGVIAEAYFAAEWLDCDCHRISPERDAAEALESELRALPPLDADEGLIHALAFDVVGLT